MMDVRPNLPLARRLPLLVLWLFSIVLVITLAMSYYEIRKSAIEAAGGGLPGLAQSLGSLVEQQSNLRLTAMRRVARDTAVQSALRSRAATPSAATAKALSALTLAPTDTATPAELWN